MLHEANPLKPASTSTQCRFDLAVLLERRVKICATTIANRHAIGPRLTGCRYRKLQPAIVIGAFIFAARASGSFSAAIVSAKILSAEMSRMQR